MTLDPEDIVERGYDRIARDHLAWSARIDGDPRGRFLEDLAARLAPGAAVADLGCGAGVPSTAALAERFDVLGVDIFGAQLEWLGVPMYFSGHTRDINRELLRATEFELVVDEPVTMREPGGTATFHWVLARRPVPSAAAR